MPDVNQSACAAQHRNGILQTLDQEFCLRVALFFGCVFINAVAEHEKDSAWVTEVAGAYRHQIIERPRALVIESGAREPDIVTQEPGLIIEGAIITAMVTQNSQAAHIARLAAKDILR